MRLLITLIPLLLIGFVSFAQQATFKGKVVDSTSAEGLYSANVVLKGSTVGTITDFGGAFELQVEPGLHTFEISYLGYETRELTYEMEAGQVIDLYIILNKISVNLGPVVVSTSKYGKKIEEETISMEVLKPELLENNAITNVTDAVEKVPGITVIDGQASIRGGSGYAYGVGSRVIMVIDDMALLTPERSEIPWDFLPVETVEQIELVKGASSVQYGSGALNGIINIRTVWPGKEPETNIVTYSRFYDNPPEESYNWWADSDTGYRYKPHLMGMYASHQQKFGRLDLVVGGMMESYQTHLMADFKHRIRGNFKLRYRPEGIEGLSFGLNGGIMYRKNSFSFFWKSASQPYLPFPGVIQDDEQVYWNLDPWVTYFDKKNNKHKLQFRYFWQQFTDSGKPKPTAQFYFGEYQFQHTFPDDATLTAGVSNQFFKAYAAGLGGNYTGHLGGIYLQGDKKFGALTLAAGGRFEYYYLDSSFIATEPVFRLGLNYQWKEDNFLRASFGQSFRVPGLAERFVDEELGSIQVKPNPDIRPEKGYTIELGYKRSFEVSSWKAYADAVVFFTQFEDMVEFQFAIEPPFNPTFRSINVSNARVFGTELTLSSTGKIGEVELNSLLGYTYTYPVDLNADTSLRRLGAFFGGAVDAFSKPDSVTLLSLLKYRVRHLLKADIDATYKGWSVGTSLRYYGFIDNVDLFLLAFIPGLPDYRRENPGGQLAWDFRVGYEINENIDLNFVVKNILNTDYAIRPAKPEPPRNFTVQAKFSF